MYLLQGCQRAHNLQSINQSKFHSLRNFLKAILRYYIHENRTDGQSKHLSGNTDWFSISEGYKLHHRTAFLK